MPLIITIIAFIIILGGVVFVHELGHFLAAKRNGVKVEEFVLGFPPLIFKKKVGETVYGLGLIPFGGYNRIYGMDDPNDTAALSDSRAYESQKPLAKFWIASGGILMNLALAAIIFYFLAVSSGFQFWQALIYDDYKFPVGQQQNFPMVAGVFDGTPAQAAGLESRDVILSANGTSFSGSQQFMNFISENQEKEVTLKLENSRNGERKEVKVILGKETDENQALGVYLMDAALLSYKTPLEKASAGFLHSFNITHFSFAMIGQIVGNSIAEKNTDLLGTSFVGPVGIYAATKIMVDQGWFEIFNFLAIISLALATTNILPIPAFDGGKIVFIGLQAIDKKRFSLQMQAKVEQTGAVILIGLAVLITLKDFWFFKGIIF
ncbi:MAG: M50 family metallopeptidase [Candidatus Paceibacterota bacterium]|jgi:regulator of sigma E protease